MNILYNCLYIGVHKKHNVKCKIYHAMQKNAIQTYIETNREKMNQMNLDRYHKNTNLSEYKGKERVI